MDKIPSEEYESFYIAQDVILFNCRGEVLALRHSLSGKWLLPGGHINKGEDWKDALVREIKEETGLTEVEIENKASVDSWVNFLGPHYGAFFIGKTDKEKIVLSGEHTEYRWLKSLEEIEGLDWWCDPLRKRVLSAAARYRGEKYS